MNIKGHEGNVSQGPSSLKWAGVKIATIDTGLTSPVEPTPIAVKDFVTLGGDGVDRSGFSAHLHGFSRAGRSPSSVLQAEAAGNSGPRANEALSSVEAVKDPKFNLKILGKSSTSAIASIREGMEFAFRTQAELNRTYDGLG